MKIKISEATELQLNWLVAKALRYTDYPEDSLEHGLIWYIDPDKTPFGRIVEKRYFKPATDWSQGGPIIERERIDPDPIEIWEDVGLVKIWGASIDYGYQQEGPTLLIAAMRCYVASKLGDDVDIPEELK